MPLTSQALHGLIPAPILPMRTGGEIDLDALSDYVNWLADQGAVALAINVDTGEGGHLAHRERLTVLERVKASVSLPCIAGVHGPFTRQAVEEARDLKEAGADGFLVFPITAYLSAPLDPAIPLEYHRAIAEVGVPLVLFQLQPSLGGTIFDEKLLRDLLQIDNVVAIKEASFDALVFKNTVRIVREVRPETAILTGNDNFLIESFLMGADGGLLGFGSIMTREMVQAIEAWKRHDLESALELGRRCQGLADALFAPPVSKYRARTKFALASIGALNPETTVVREPLRPINDQDKTLLRRALEEAGILDPIPA